ncbi:MAG TPA: DNA/RNA nuclease SfsA [Bacillota bacterium]|nr:DNA/RNA nuclease SfsA [Bacillota bacterium]HPT87274.1 DNA/RNA nuclease SfsA [Bacillota bacterium]
MVYKKIKHGIFCERLNRFIARVKVDDVIETVHVKNTGRCRELLQPGVTVILEDAGHTGRKTRYSLVEVYKGATLINMDSQAPNHVVYEALCQGKLQELGTPVRVAKEVTYGKSRFDLYYENENGKGFIEVKGVTLEDKGIAMFPDAPTERGAKHLMELIEAVREGYQGWIFFLIQMQGVSVFRPNRAMDPQFAQVLQLAQKCGVRVLAYDAVVTENGMTLGHPVPVELE